MPAANYYYLKDDPFYAGLASASRRAQRPARHRHQRADRAARRATPAACLDLRGKRLGHINSYCTTSYFSAAILLAEHDVPFGTVLLHGRARRRLAAPDRCGRRRHELTRPWSEKGIWLDKPANAAATKIIGSVDLAARAGDRVGHVGRPGFRVRVPDQAAGVPDRGAGPAVPGLHRLLHRCGAGVLRSERARVCRCGELAYACVTPILAVSGPIAPSDEAG